jgi:hypothetical protein
MASEGRTTQSAEAIRDRAAEAWPATAAGPRADLRIGGPDRIDPAVGPGDLPVPWTREVGLLILISAVLGSVAHLMGSGASWSLLFWPLLYAVARLSLHLVPAPPPTPVRLPSSPGQPSRPPSGSRYPTVSCDIGGRTRTESSPPALGGTRASY